MPKISKETLADKAKTILLMLADAGQVEDNLLIRSYMPEQRMNQGETMIAQAVHFIERQEYESMLPWLLQSNPGEWIAINRHDLIGIYPTYGDAIREGYAYTQSQDKDIKDAPFVIQILEQQPEHF